MESVTDEEDDASQGGASSSMSSSRVASSGVSSAGSCSIPRAKVGRPRGKPARLLPYEFSVTIGLDGEDLDVVRVGPLIAEYLDRNATQAFLTSERGEIEKHLHLQGVVVITTTSPQAFKKSLISVMKFPDNETPHNLKISLKQLTHKGLHTITGIVGYARKEKNEAHYSEIVVKNISDEMMEEGDLMYLLHGKIQNNKKRVSLCQYNLINKMLVFLKYKCDNLVAYSHDPLSLIVKMVNSGHYELESKWIADRSGLGLNRLKALWRANVAPEDVTEEDIRKIMFPRDSLSDHSCGGRDGLGPQRAGLFGDSDDDIDRQTFTRYFDYQNVLKRVHKGDKKEGRVHAASTYKFHTALNNWRAQRLSVRVTNLVNTFDEESYEHMGDNDMIYFSMMTRDTHAHVEMVTEEVDSVLSNLKAWREGGTVEDDTVGVFDDKRDFVSLLD